MRDLASVGGLVIDWLGSLGGLRLIDNFSKLAYHLVLSCV